MQIPSDQSQARQVSSECCHSLGDWWVRSVHSEEAGREGSTPKSVHSSDADVFEKAEGSIQQQPLLRGCAGIGGVSSPGHVSKEVGREPKRAPHSLPHQEERLWMGREIRATKGRPKEARKDGRAVLQPHSTGEGGEPQGFRKERPRNPLEGRGKQAYESVVRRHSRDSELESLCAQTSTE